MAMAGSNGSLDTAAFHGGGSHKCGKFRGGPRSLQKSRVLGSKPLKVGGAHTDGEWGEPVHGCHAANEGVVWNAPVDEAACSSMMH